MYWNCIHFIISPLLTRFLVKVMQISSKIKSPQILLFHTQNEEFLLIKNTRNCISFMNFFIVEVQIDFSSWNQCSLIFMLHCCTNQSPSFPQLCNSFQKNNARIKNAWFQQTMVSPKSLILLFNWGAYISCGQSLPTINLIWVRVPNFVQ